MAKNLQQLKRRIKTAKNVSQIAKAMEMMSASKIKRAQKKVENNKPYAERIGILTSTLVKNLGESSVKHPYIEGNESDKSLLIAISPERGLCGSLNTNLFKKLLSVENPNTSLITVGRKIEAFAARTKFNFIASYPMPTSIPSYSMVYEIAKLVNDSFNSGFVGRVDILFANFESFFTQTPVVKSLLPVNTEFLGVSEDYFHLFEPQAKVLLDVLLPKYLDVSIYSALIEAYTSEQAARMVAMQSAKNNANDMANYLGLVYNKTRQEKITNEILDLSNNQA